MDFRFKIILVFLIASGGLLSDIHAQGMMWRPLGVGISAGEADHQSITVDNEGRVWVAYRDLQHDRKTTVLTYESGEWRVAGEEGFTEDRTVFQDIHAAEDGSVWLAYQDNFNFNRTTVVSWQCRQQGDKEMHELDLDLPVIVALFQNYPNPFNPSTVIEFELPPSEHVRLDIYTSDGRFVRTLLDEERQMGRHEVVFDASGLSSGVYLYRLQAGNVTRTESMTYVK